MRSWSRERQRSSVDMRLKIDKAHLRKVAIANGMASMQDGEPGSGMAIQSDLMARMKAGSRSVQELTDFCKTTTKKQGETSSNESDGQPPKSDNEDAPFLYHPFKLGSQPSSITMNIRNAKQLPVLTPAEKSAQLSTLRLQFPVSSGSQHRSKERAWVLYEKPEPLLKKPAETNVASVAEVKPVPDAEQVFPDPLSEVVNVATIHSIIIRDIFCAM